MNPACAAPTPPAATGPVAMSTRHGAARSSGRISARKRTPEAAPGLDGSADDDELRTALGRHASDLVADPTRTCADNLLPQRDTAGAHRRRGRREPLLQRRHARRRSARPAAALARRRAGPGGRSALRGPRRGGRRDRARARSPPSFEQRHDDASGRRSRALQRAEPPRPPRKRTRRSGTLSLIERAGTAPTRGSRSARRGAAASRRAPAGCGGAARQPRKMSSGRSTSRARLPSSVRLAQVAEKRVADVPVRSLETSSGTRGASARHSSRISARLPLVEREVDGARVGMPERLGVVDGAHRSRVDAGDEDARRASRSGRRGASSTVGTSATTTPGSVEQPELQRNSTGAAPARRDAAAELLGDDDGDEVGLPARQPPDLLEHGLGGAAVRVEGLERGAPPVRSNQRGRMPGSRAARAARGSRADASAGDRRGEPERLAPSPRPDVSTSRSACSRAAAPRRPRPRPRAAAGDRP